MLLLNFYSSATATVKNQIFKGMTVVRKIGRGKSNLITKNQFLCPQGEVSSVVFRQVISTPLLNLIYFTKEKRKNH